MSCIFIDCDYAAEWFDSIWVSTLENQTDVGLISSRCDAVSVRFDFGFYPFGSEDESSKKRLFNYFVYS
jgi:hypothetical protein